MRKSLFISILLVAAFILTSCNFAFGPGGGQGNVTNKGIYKSDNQGEAWIEKNVLAESDTNLARFNVHQLAFDIFDSNILYHASDAGLFISENSGDSWRQIYGSAVNNFALNPKTRGIIYIASGNQLYKTTDNGENWQLIYSEAKPNINIASLAISHFDTSYIYVLTNDGTLLLSSDWGESWKAISNFENKNTLKVLISPTNSQIILVSAINALYRSFDQGKTWQEIIQDKRLDYPGIDQVKDLQFVPLSNQLSFLSQYGLLTSFDYGSTWQEITLIASPKSVNINTFTYNPINPDEIYYSVNNILYHTIDNGRNWKTKALPIPTGARASQLLINPDNTHILYLGIKQ